MNFANDITLELKEREAELSLIREGLKKKASRIPNVRSKNGMAIGTTGFRDCLYLYLIVRTIKPKACLEVGTYIGSSAVMIAEALYKNGGSGFLTTCDKKRVNVIPESYSNINIVNHSSHQLLSALSGVEFDFVFIDGWASKSTVQKEIPLLEKCLASNAVLSFHDFKENQKGKMCKSLIDEYIGSGNAAGYFKQNFIWVYPEVIDIEGVKINNSTLLLIPERKVENE